jgi:hypothetical protein
MPSPVGHSLMGFIIYHVSARRLLAHRWRLIGLYLFAANTPDLDFIPGLVLGNLNLTYDELKIQTRKQDLFRIRFFTYNIQERR